MPAPDVADTLIISLAAATASFVNRAFPRQNRDTARVVEIVGGLLVTQLAKNTMSKNVGAGAVVGALVGFVEEALQVRTEGFTTSTVPSPSRGIALIPSVVAYGPTGRAVLSGYVQVLHTSSTFP